MLTRSFLNANELPLVLSPVAQAQRLGLGAWLAVIARELAVLNGELKKFGALLFRGLPIRDAEDMERVVRLFGGELLDYRGGAVPRSRIQGRIFNSTELNRHYRIRIHNELSYQPTFPRLICFFCQTPSTSGGETIIADCRKVLAAIPRDVVELFRRKNVKYTRVFQRHSPVRELVKKAIPTYFHMTWENVFQTCDRSEVENICAQLGMDCAWRPNGDLEVTNILPAVVDHAGTGEAVWFSHLNLFYPSVRVLGSPVYLTRKVLYRHAADTPNQVRFGDGSEIPSKAADSIFDAIESNTIAFPWQRGDLMVVDNRLVGHGRNPYAGERRVLVSMHA